MNAKMMIAGMALVVGLGAAVPAHADSLRFGVHGRRGGISVGFGYYPAQVYAAPVYAAPAPYYVAPGPVVVDEPVIVGGGYYGGYYGGGGGRGFSRGGRGGHRR